MIVTLTANPSMDATITVGGPLVRGSVLRGGDSTDQAGGKGVNISRAAVAAGVDTRAVFPADVHGEFVRELSGAGVDCLPSTPSGPVRVNVAITEPDGTTTKLNSPGTPLTPAHVDDLVGTVIAASRGADWVVLAGSLPPGAPDDLYARLVPELGTRAAVDTSDASLAALVAGFPRSAPRLMKPNADELATLIGRDPAELEDDPAEAARAAGELVAGGVGAVLVTLGAKGAVLVTGEGAWFAEAPAVEVRSTVGAGDSSLFGYLLGDLRELDPAARLALAVAYGSAAASLPGTTIPRPDQVDPERVRVRRLDV